MRTKPRWRGPTFLALLPIAAAVVALVPTGYALDVFLHLITGREYDLFMSGLTYHGSLYVILSTILSSTLSGIGCLTRYRTASIGFGCWAPTMAFAYFWSIAHVRIMPDG